MKKTKVEVTEDKKAYPHHGLANAAYYFHEEIKKRITADDRGGLGAEKMAGLAMLAFTVEARFNFLGTKLVTDWDDGCRFRCKVRDVLKALDVKLDWGAEPYQTVGKLHKLRNLLAHAKPEELAVTYEATLTEKQKEALIKPACEYEAYLDDEFYTKAYDTAETIWKELLQKAKIDPADLLTNKSVSIKVIPETG